MAAEQGKYGASDTFAFDTELVRDDNDNEDLANKFHKQTKINARGRIHLFCDRMEDTADLILIEALSNKNSRMALLDARQALLSKLWEFRDMADAEDDFDELEYQAQMGTLNVINRKLNSLSQKIDNMMRGADESSDDTDGDGEDEQVQALKEARKKLPFLLNADARSY